MRIKYIATLIILLLLCRCAFARQVTYHGMADASAAVFLDSGHFVAADDESNRLRIYRVSETGKPLALMDLDAFLGADGQHPEADIEAAARVGDVLYWITSHGRNKDGKLRPSRYRFFATEIQYQGDEKIFSRLVPLGLPCSTLIDQFLASSASAGLDLNEAVRKNEELPKKEREKLAPKEKGLNVEAMTWMPESKSLLIGLRNPLLKPGRKAILFELINPQEVIEGKPARFGRVLLWDLSRRGLRGMEYDPGRRIYYILAGAVDGETTSALFTWDGDFKHAPKQISEWPEEDRPFTPEGIAIHPGTNEIWIFSDDGTLQIPVQSPDQCMDGELLDSGDCPNKYLTDDLQKTFRVRIYKQPLKILEN